MGPIQKSIVLVIKINWLLAECRALLVLNLYISIEKEVLTPFYRQPLPSSYKYGGYSLGIHSQRVSLDLVNNVFCQATL